MDAFPVEILHLIFGQLRPAAETDLDDDCSEQSSYVPDVSERRLAWRACHDIMNVRLTCRRFRDSSSHLLLSVLDVSISEESLARFELLASNPLLSDGIHTVRVHVNVYDGVAAESMSKYVPRAIAAMSEYHAHARRDAHLSGWGSWSVQPEDQSHVNYAGESYVIPRSSLYEPPTEAELLIAAWRKYLASGFAEPKSEDSRRRCRLLDLLFARFQESVADEQRLLCDGSFPRRLATAIKKMPRVPVLHIDDEMHSFFSSRGEASQPHQRKLDSLESLTVLIGPTRQPWSMLYYAFLGRQTSTIHIEEYMPNQEYIERVAAVAPWELLVQLPLAAFQAGIALKGLVLAVSAIPRTFDRSMLDDKEMGDLIASTNMLETFRLSAYCIDVTTALSHEPGSTFSLVAIFAASHSLQRLRLVCPIQKGPKDHLVHPSMLPQISEPAMTQLKPVFAHGLGPSLKSFVSSRCDYSLADLKGLLQNVRLESPAIVVIRALRMTKEGDRAELEAWAEALDFLRTKCARGSAIDFPGAGGRRVLPEATLEKIFGDDPDLPRTIDSLPRGATSLASLYVTRQATENPLRKLLL